MLYELRVKDLPQGRLQVTLLQTLTHEAVGRPRREGRERYLFRGKVAGTLGLKRTADDVAMLLAVLGVVCDELDPWTVPSGQLELDEDEYEHKDGYPAE